MGLLLDRIQTLVRSILMLIVHATCCPCFVENDAYIRLTIYIHIVLYTTTHTCAAGLLAKDFMNIYEADNDNVE